jgi:hypothetical protein
MHIISVDVSVFPQCHVWYKNVFSDKRDYIIITFATSANIYVLMDKLWWKVVRTQESWLYSSVNVNIAHIAVQLQHNDRVQQLCVAVLHKLHCSGRLEEVQKDNDCSYTMCSAWWISYSPTIDYPSTFRHKLPKVKRLSDLEYWHYEKKCLP